MASVSVTITGVMWDHTSKSGRPVTLVGEGYLTGVGVGGGPSPGGPPLGTWGGGGVGDYVDAGLPGQQPGGPVGIWGGPFQPPIASQGPGFPTNPIYIPRPPVDFPTPPSGGNKPPPEGGGWGYSNQYGWGYFPMVSDKPQPGGPQTPPAKPA